MRAQYIVNSERWNDPVVAWRLEVANAGVVAQAIDAFATGYAALRRGERSPAAAALGELQARARGRPVDDFYSANTTVPQVLERELRALLLLEENKRSEALALLREAATMEDAIPLEFGPPDIVKPTHELLGEVLLAAGQPAEAQREFQRALELGPGRARSLLGLARAAAAAGDRNAAQRALGILKRNWHAADADLPERTVVAELERLLGGR
jgi:tetratricopeptide (TPR) repeat protein